MPQSAPLSVPRPVIHHSAALRAVAAALARAEAFGINVVVAVVDSNARLCAFARMPNAFLISNEVALRKAISVAMVGMPGDVLEAALTAEAPRVLAGLASTTDFTLIRGGLPILDNGVVIGAISVSGGSEAQDVTCAEAGVAAATQGA